MKLYMAQYGTVNKTLKCYKSTAGSVFKQKLIMLKGAKLFSKFNIVLY